MSWPIVHMAAGIAIQALASANHPLLGAVVAVPVAAFTHSALDDMNVDKFYILHHFGKDWVGHVLKGVAVLLHIPLLVWLYLNPLYLIGALAAMWADIEHPIRWYIRWRTGKRVASWIHMGILFPAWAHTRWGVVAQLALAVLLLVAIWL